MDYDFLDFFVGAKIFEITWFEFVPLGFTTYSEQAESLPQLLIGLKDFKWENLKDFDAHLSLFYKFDILHAKFYSVTYPQFCDVDLASFITSRKAVSCGYQNSTHISIAPLHTIDPFWSISPLTLFAPKLNGPQPYFTLSLSDILFPAKKQVPTSVDDEAD